MDGGLLSILDILYTATWSERSRYKNNLVLGVNDQGPKPGPVKHRPYFSRAVRTLAVKRHEGKTNPHIPKNLRERQFPIEERKLLEREWKSWGWNVNNIWSQPLLRQPCGSHENGKS